MGCTSTGMDLGLDTYHTTPKPLSHRDILVINTTEVGSLIRLPLLLPRLRQLRLDPRRHLLLLPIHRISLGLCLGRPLLSRRRVLLVLLHVRNLDFHRIESFGARYRVLLLPHLFFHLLHRDTEALVAPQICLVIFQIQDLALEVELRQHVHCFAEYRVTKWRTYGCEGVEVGVVREVSCAETDPVPSRSSAVLVSIMLRFRLGRNN
jgi:hypothetical protein